MHFPIIAIESLETDRADWKRDLGYEDSALNEHTDYYGEMYSEVERRRYIKSGHLAKLLDGIATVDTERETITFLDADTINKTIQDYFQSKAKELTAQSFLSGWAFKNVGFYWRGSSTMFFKCFEYQYGQTSVDFVEAAPYHAGETVQIGNIFDAHY